MRRLRTRFPASALAALGVAAVLLIARHSLAAQQQEPQEDEIPTCDVFALRDTAFSITVQPAGGTFDLGGGNRLTFGPNAVDAPTTYRIRVGEPARGRKIAGVNIVPVGAGRTQFEQAVTLRLSYAGCSFENTDRVPYIVRRGGGRPERVGGTRNPAGKFVEAVVTRFSGFAIAI